MNIQDLAIATMTWARNEEEEILLKKSLSALAGFGAGIYLTDGGSTKSFIDYLQTLANTSLQPQSQGLWMQTSSSLSASHQSGKAFTFYTEPDKYIFFTEALKSVLNEISVENNTGIVLMSRDKNSFKTFPQFQQKTESAINVCCSEVIGENFDFVYGPFLINSKIIPYLANVPKTIGWGWRPYAFNVARRLGYKIISVEGNFICPPAQQQDTPNERIYRMRQLTQNIEGLILSTQAELL